MTLCIGMNVDYVSFLCVINLIRFSSYQLPQCISSSTKYSDGVVNSVAHVIKSHVASHSLK